MKVDKILIPFLCSFVVYIIIAESPTFDFSQNFFAPRYRCKMQTVSKFIYALDL